MDPDPTAIDDYIRANRGTYTHEAIRDNLVSAGHDPLAVDAAFTRAGSGTAWNPAPEESSAGALIAVAWVLFIFCGLLGLAGFALATAFSTTGSLPIFLIAYVGIGLAIVLATGWAVPKLGIRGVWAGVIGVALVPIFGALTWGTCVAAFRMGAG